MVQIPIYGIASDISAQDSGWLRQFRSCMQELDWSFDSLQRAVDLIRHHRLPCYLQSGPLGNLSFLLFNHSPLPGVPPTLLFRLSEHHFELPRGFDKWDERFDFMSQFTHTDENRQILAFYDLPDPGSRRDYEY